MDDKQSIVSGLVKGKATSGIPALDAMKRYLKDRHDYQHMKTEQLVADAERGKESLFQKDGHLDPTNREQMMAFGRAFPAQVVREKLKKLRPSLFFERSIGAPSTCGIYIPHPRGTHHGNLLHLMGMEWEGLVPQGTIREIPKSAPQYGSRLICETRGWAKVIETLSKMGLFAWHDAWREFDGREYSHNLGVLVGLFEDGER